MRTRVVVIVAVGAVTTTLTLRCVAMKLRRQLSMMRIFPPHRRRTARPGRTPRSVAIRTRRRAIRAFAGTPMSHQHVRRLNERRGQTRSTDCRKATRAFTISSAAVRDECSYPGFMRRPGFFGVLHRVPGNAWRILRKKYWPSR